MNLINIFSDSVKLTIEDILFIVGPNISHMSKEEVRPKILNFNRILNPISILLMMRITPLKT